jgi:transcriptional regulator with XRE-family HTH domain
MANVKELLATNLIFSRVRLDLSQKQVAQLSGLSLACIKQLEAAKKFPKAEVLERLSEVLDRKPCQFFYEGDEWEDHDSIDNLAGLYIILTEKINDLLKKTVYRYLDM